MKFKVGDKVLLRSTITEIDPECDSGLVYRVNVGEDRFGSWQKEDVVAPDTQAPPETLTAAETALYTQAAEIIGKIRSEADTKTAQVMQRFLEPLRKDRPELADAEVRIVPAEDGQLKVEVVS